MTTVTRICSYCGEYYEVDSRSHSTEYNCCGSNECKAAKARRWEEDHPRAPEPEPVVWNRHLDSRPYTLIHDPDGTLKPGAKFSAVDFQESKKLGVWLPGTVFERRDGRRVTI